MYREDSWVISSGILNRDVFAWMLLWHLFEQTIYLKLLVYATHDLQAPKIEIEISNWGKINKKITFLPLEGKPKHFFQIRYLCSLEEKLTFWEGFEQFPLLCRIFCFHMRRPKVDVSIWITRLCSFHPEIILHLVKWGKANDFWLHF